MQIGFNLPISGPLSSPDSVIRIAQQGEALGYDYLTLTDHVVLPNLRSPPISVPRPGRQTPRSAGRARQPPRPRRPLPRRQSIPACASCSAPGFRQGQPARRPRRGGDLRFRCDSRRQAAQGARRASASASSTTHTITGIGPIGRIAQHSSMTVRSPGIIRGASRLLPNAAAMDGSQDVPIACGRQHGAHSQDRRLRLVGRHDAAKRRPAHIAATTSAAMAVTASCAVHAASA